MEADLLLHVMDGSSAQMLQQREAVLAVLRRLGVSEMRLQNSLIEVVNKSDLFSGKAQSEMLGEAPDLDAPDLETNDLEGPDFINGVGTSKSRGSAKEPGVVHTSEGPGGGGGVTSVGGSEDAQSHSGERQSASADCSGASTQPEPGAVSTSNSSSSSGSGVRDGAASGDWGKRWESRGECTGRGEGLLLFGKHISSNLPLGFGQCAIMVYASGKRLSQRTSQGVNMLPRAA